MARIGYTAIRVARIVKYSAGAGNACGHILTGGPIHIRLFVRFKLGPLGQLAAWQLTGHWPPNATTTIDYILQPHDGRADVTFTGTLVPQITSYVGWKAVHEYKIGDLSNAAYDSFVESNGCQDALSQPLHREVTVLSDPIDVQEMDTSADYKS